MQQTQKYLDDANRQLEETIARERETRLLVDGVEERVRVESKATKDRADAAAAEILATADAAAKKTVDEADSRSEQLVSDAEERLAKIRVERDAVAGYFEGLRGALSQAEKTAAED